MPWLAAHAQALTPFSTAATYDSFAVRCTHALSETMLVSALADARLKCTFTHIAALIGKDTAKANEVLLTLSQFDLKPHLKCELEAYSLSHHIRKT